ncbi:uncharacterized protein G2W53_003570 [Senna tora]|uniref:Uncharacterized protein n=1 Tax=Senna tora TaxID=362788 RepID=A0A834XB01_9FABA|nr:uncharacterized protein G2W53_003570 [Senna tora]
MDVLLHPPPITPDEKRVTPPALTKFEDGSLLLAIQKFNMCKKKKKSMILARKSDKWKKAKFFGQNSKLRRQDTPRIHQEDPRNQFLDKNKMQGRITNRVCQGWSCVVNEPKRIIELLDRVDEFVIKEKAYFSKKGLTFPNDEREESKKRKDEYQRGDERKRERQGPLISKFPSYNLEERPPPSGVIEVIARGIQKGKPSEEKETKPITFSFSDFSETNPERDDLMVITFTAAIDHGYDVKRILIDHGTSVEILYYKTFKSGIRDLYLQPFKGTLVDFSGTKVQTKGTIRARVSTGTTPKIASHRAEFSQEEECVLQKGFRQARYLVEAKEAPQDFVDVRAYSSDLEAPELRHFDGDPLLVDDFVRCGRKEIVYEDCLRFWIVSMPKRTTIKHHEPPTADRRKSPNEVVDRS